MRLCIEDATAVDVDPAELEQGDEYVFPCGCRFSIRRDLPAVRAGHGAVVYEPEDIPLDCKATWSLISSGRTKGVFQLEGGGGKKLAKRVKPRSIEELSAVNALLRPGCQNVKDDRGVAMPELYARRKHGEEESVCEIEATRKILEPTYFIMCYQEQMMQMARVLAGFNLVEVDKLRKAAGKKDQQLMSEVGKLFIDRAEEHGVITREQAVLVFDQIKKSGSYLFNKAHSVSYAVNGYTSAHAKAHFPLYFYVSYLAWAREKQKPLPEIRQLVNDARHFGIEVVPPRFVELRDHFGTDDSGVRVTFGLADVKGIGDKAVLKIRGASPPREVLLGWGWFDFLTKFSHVCGANVVRAMIKVGALRDLSPHRQRMLAEYEAWNRLSDGERNQVIGLAEPVYERHAVKDEVTTEVEEPVYDKAEMKAYRDAVIVYQHDLNQVECDEENEGPHPDEPAHPKPTATRTRFKKKLVTRKDGEGKTVYEETETLIDGARPVTSLEGALAAVLERPGAVTKRRREHVASLLGLLRDPPSSLEDSVYWVARQEEEHLGVALTCSNVQTADLSDVDTTAAEYIAGKDAGRGLMTLGVEVQELNEREVRTGKNKGAKMANLVVSDRTGVLDNVVIFPEAWRDFGHLVNRANAVVALTGKRSRKVGDDGFVVESISEL